MKLSITALFKVSRSLKACLMAASLTVVAATAEPAQSASSGDDDSAIRAQANAYAKAFAAGDAKSLAQMWSADGSFTDCNGQDYKGRDALEKYFRQYFNDRGSAQTLDINIESIKFPAANVAIEEGTSRISSGPDKGSTGHYIAVHTKNNGQWQMQTASETNCVPASGADNLKDLGWLVGTWSIKGQPHAAHLKVSWSKNKTFLVCQYLSEDKSAPLEELQIIGWDPLGHSIICWHFGAAGGYGIGHLAYDGRAWVENAAATESSGTTGSARYRLTQLDKDNFSWQSSGRSRAGKRLPDSTALTITRDTQNVQ